MADITKYIDKAHEGKDFAELADMPIDVLQGVSKGDVEALQKAFGVKTMRDLATNKYILVAQAITGLAGVEKK